MGGSRGGGKGRGRRGGEGGVKPPEVNGSFFGHVRRRKHPLELLAIDAAETTTEERGLNQRDKLGGVGGEVGDGGGWGYVCVCGCAGMCADARGCLRVR